MNRYSLFIANSPVELCSALAVIEHLEIKDGIIVIEHNINMAEGTMDAFITAVAAKNPDVVFLHLRLDRALPRSSIPMLRAIRYLNHKNAQIDRALRDRFDFGLADLGKRVHTIYFNFRNDLTILLLDACRASKRVLFPHGFDQPRKEQVRKHACLYRRRSVSNAISWMRDQKMPLGHAMIGMVLGRAGLFSAYVPFDGVDQVLTFRSTPLEIQTDLRVIPNLKSVLCWICEFPEWAVELRAWTSVLPDLAVLLLLPECNQPRIWEVNRNFLLAHVELVRSVTSHVGSSHVVVKAHPRSDNSAAMWLVASLQECLPGVTVELLPGSLYRLPVEALVISTTMACACSMGSCSLPSDIGIDFTHFVSSKAAAMFDAGWAEPFWHNYERGAAMLVDEGICRDIDLPELPLAVEIPDTRG